MLLPQLRRRGVPGRLRWCLPRRYRAASPVAEPSHGAAAAALGAALVGAAVAAAAATAVCERDRRASALCHEAGADAPGSCGPFVERLRRETGLLLQRAAAEGGSYNK